MNSLDDKTEQLDLDEINEELNKDTEKKKKVIIGIIIGCGIIFILVLALLLTSLFSSKKSTNDQAEATPTPTSETENTDVLGYYAMQQANTAILSKLDEIYGTDGYIKPDTSEYKVSGSETQATIKFTLEVNKDNSTYATPATFQLKWNANDETFDVDDYKIDDEKAKKTDFVEKNNDSNKQKDADNTDGTTPNEADLAKTYSISVNNSVTVTLTSSSDATVSVYAVASDGTSTEIAEATNETVNKTVELPAGNYELQLYAPGGSGYNWSYSYN